MQVLALLNKLMASLLCLAMAYRAVYTAVALLGKDKPQPAGRAQGRYGVLIAARNEEAVLGNLLSSLAAQDYPAEKLQVFVIADNCTDNTAQVAWRNGAEVWSRFDRTRVGKGYALNALLRHVAEKYGLSSFDGFFVLDADNTLEPDYIFQMDRAFAPEYAAMTSYRNSRNYADSWVSAGQALGFLQSSVYLNHARMRLGLGCMVSGTGFVFRPEVLPPEGWNYFFMGEDIQFSVERHLKGEKIGYCPQAVFYDEQPAGLSQSCRQRLRWNKGYFQVLGRYGAALCRQLLAGPGWRSRMIAFDILATVGAGVLLPAACLLANALLMLGGILSGNGPAALAGALHTALLGYRTLFLMGALTTLTEWRRICATPWQKLWYMLTFPVYTASYMPITLAALVLKVEWKPILHTGSCATAPRKRAG